jgi:hypothetical protein
MYSSSDNNFRQHWIERVKMNKLPFIIATIVLIGLLPATGCQTDGGEAYTTLPIERLPPATGEEAPDDIVPTPGGLAYKANVHHQGVENPWPPIESTEVVLGSGSDALNISYRDYIETEAGETRNNIIHVWKEGGLFDSRLRLYSVTVPDGIGLTDGGRGVGLPGATGAILVIEVAPDVAPGQYTFEIGIDLGGKDYGTIPCTIEVLEERINQSQEAVRLDQARPYLIVSEGNLANEDPCRSVGLWLITSKDASSFKEYAQTAVQAVIDLYNLYKRDYTSVILIPRDGVEIAYAQANFAADGKGAAGMTGSAPAVEHYWKIWASDRELNEQELTVAELWFAKQQDFPEQNPLSSLSYDAEALRQYIADTLNIPYDEVQMPELKMLEYVLDQVFIDWTVSLAAHRIPGKPVTETALESLWGSVNLGNSEKAFINALVNETPEELKNQFAMKYETAEQVSRDSCWGCSVVGGHIHGQANTSCSWSSVREKDRQSGHFSSRSSVPKIPILLADSFST